MLHTHRGFYAPCLLLLRFPFFLPTVVSCYCCSSSRVLWLLRSIGITLYLVSAFLCLVRSERACVRYHARLFSHFLNPIKSLPDSLLPSAFHSVDHVSHSLCSTFPIFHYFIGFRLNPSLVSLLRVFYASRFRHFEFDCVPTSPFSKGLSRWPVPLAGAPMFEFRRYLPFFLQSTSRIKQ